MRKLFKKKASNTGFSYRTKCESLLEQFFYLRKIVKQTVYLSCPGFFYQNHQALGGRKTEKGDLRVGPKRFQGYKRFFYQSFKHIETTVGFEKIEQKM
jgi:hypothetical protein